LILTEIEKDQSPAAPADANPFVGDEPSLPPSGLSLSGALISDAMRELDTLLTEFERRLPVAGV
jgi:hypothetical protein